MAIQTFLTDLSDGIVVEYWCDGQDHFSLIEGPEDSDLNYSGACDGSCKKMTDVRERIQSIELEDICTEEGVLPSVLVLDENVEELLSSEVTMTGRKVAKWYCKRDGCGEEFCLGDQHVHISTDFVWWSGDLDPIFEQHEVTLTKCCCESTAD